VALDPFRQAPPAGRQRADEQRVAGKDCLAPAPLAGEKAGKEFE